MNLLSIFRSSPEKQIEKARKKVKEPHGDSANRINAAYRLLEIGTPEAILALLDRFTIDVSPSSQDEEEKEDVLRQIVKRGEGAVSALINFLERERQVYWPVRALKEILLTKEFEEKIDEILQYQWENPPASSDPKAQLIQLLEVPESTKLVATMKMFLEDEADDVRLAVLDHLFHCSEEESREDILRCYLNSEDRPRVQGQIMAKFVEKQWSVKGFRPQIEENLPEGHMLTREGKVQITGSNR